MGRQPYLTSLALGRSAYEPPEDGPLFVASRAGNWTSAFVSPPQTPLNAENTAGQSHNLRQDVQLYNARGHPFNPWARVRSRRAIDSMNDVLSVVGLVQRSLPVALEELGGNSLDQTKVASADENAFGEKIGWAADIDNQIFGWWIHAFTNRLLVFAPPSKSSLFEVLSMHYHAMGFGAFFFAGLPAFIFSSLVNPEIWTYQIAATVDRFVWANVQSKKRRDTYERMRPFILAPLEVLLNVFILPFRLHSMLQLLGLVPASQMLPSPRSWIPFWGTSLIQFRWENLPILPFFAYRPLSSLVHHYVYLSCRTAIMEPMNPAQRRRSSGSRFATSVNSVHLSVLPNMETAFTVVFRKVFDVFGWSHPKRITESPLWNPGLRRRETWNVNEDGDVEDIIPMPTTPISTRRHSSNVQPAPEEQPQPEGGQHLGHSPSSSNGHEHGGDREEEPERHRSDTTIRISSIDPESGTVNLEIGIPEPPLEERVPDRNADLEASQRQNRIRDGLATSADLEWLRRSEGDRKAIVAVVQSKKHRVSKLALEPTDMLASLVNSWVAGWLLMPLRAYVLGKLVNHVLAQPGLFGISRPASTLGLSLGPRGTRGYVGKLVLCCAMDVCLGLTFWLAEWAVIRSAGREFFGWGTL